MTILIRVFLLEAINGWNDTTLRDYLQATPSLRRVLGFGMLPPQTTFWRTWNHRFRVAVYDAVREFADTVVRPACTAMPLSDRYR